MLPLRYNQLYEPSSLAGSYMVRSLVSKMSYLTSFRSLKVCVLTVESLITNNAMSLTASNRRDGEDFINIGPNVRI
jgi:hypothetical protein